MKHDRLSILRAQEAARLEQKKADAFYVKAVGRSTRFRDDPAYAEDVRMFEQKPPMPKTIGVDVGGGGGAMTATGVHVVSGSTAPKPEEPKYWVCVKAYDVPNTYRVGDVRELKPMLGLEHHWLPCDKDGWVTHDPQPDSTCPVPDGVKPEAKCRCGTPEPHPSPNSWQLGVPGDRRPSMFDIVAWRPVKS